MNPQIGAVLTSIPLTDVRGVYQLFTRGNYHHYVYNEDTGSYDRVDLINYEQTYTIAGGVQIPTGNYICDHLDYWIEGYLPFHNPDGSSSGPGGDYEYFNADPSDGADETTFRWTEELVKAHGAGYEDPTLQTYDVDPGAGNWQTPSESKDADWSEGLGPPPNSPPGTPPEKSVRPFRIKTQSTFARVACTLTPSTGFCRMWFTGPFATGDSARILTWRGNQHSYPCSPPTCLLSRLWALSTDTSTGFSMDKYSFLENYEPTGSQTSPSGFPTTNP